MAATNLEGPAREEARMHSSEIIQRFVREPRQSCERLHACSCTSHPGANAPPVDPRCTAPYHRIHSARDSFAGGGGDDPKDHMGQPPKNVRLAGVRGTIC